jgi:hypothetical protein
MITHERLKELLAYDPKVGLFSWINAKSNVAAGSIAGSKRPDGRRRINIDGKFYYASRLAIFYMTGEWPAGDVDHIDLHKSNDAFDNLRACDHAHNAANCKARNVLGLKGVSKKGSRYRAYSTAKGRIRYLGTFDTPEQAIAAYMQAAVESFGQFARGT